MGEEELADFKMLPRMPMCHWDFDEEKMVVAAPSALSKTKGSGGKSKRKGPHFFYAIDPKRTIDQLELKARKNMDKYAEEVLYLIHFCRSDLRTHRIALSLRSFWHWQVRGFSCLSGVVWFVLWFVCSVASIDWISAENRAVPGTGHDGGPIHCPNTKGVQSGAPGCPRSW